MGQKDKEIRDLKDLLGQKELRIQELKDSLRSTRRKQTRAMAKYESYSDDDPNYFHSDEVNSDDDESEAISAEAMRKVPSRRPTRQTRQTRRASKEEPATKTATTTNDLPATVTKGKTRGRPRRKTAGDNETKVKAANAATNDTTDTTTRGRKSKGKERAFAMPVPTIPSPPTAEPEQTREETIPEAFHDAPHESDEPNQQEEASEAVAADAPGQEQTNEAQPEEDLTGADRSPILGDSMDDFQPPVPVRKPPTSSPEPVPEPAPAPAPESEAESEPEAPPAKPTRRRRTLRDRKRALPDPEFDMSPLSKVNKTVKDG